MKLIPRETSLVVAGAWNPAILSPEWVMRHGLVQPPEGINVQVMLPVMGQFFEFPRYTVPGVQYTARPDAFVIFPGEMTQQSFEALEVAVGRILEQLSHTPITGVGHNFEFQEEDPSPAHVASVALAQGDIVERTPEGWQVASNTVATSLRDGQRVINIQRYYDGTKLGIKFNFHHAVTSATGARAVLNGADGFARFFNNYHQACAIATGLYGELEHEDHIQH